MPEPCTSLSTLSLWRSTIVRASVIVPALTASTSAPAVPVSTVAVASPGSGLVTKRDTSNVAPLALADTWRGFAPTASVAWTAPLAGSSLSSWPVASSTTKALPPGANTRPCGCAARGNATVAATASVAGLTMLMPDDALLVTQTRPSGATATLRGEPPTAISATRVLVAVSITATVSLSGLATHRRAEALARLSSAVADEATGRPGATGAVTAWRKLRVDVEPSAARAVSVTP